jgi:hypothetical protein
MSTRAAESAAPFHVCGRASQRLLRHSHVRGRASQSPPRHSHVCGKAPQSGRGRAAIAGMGRNSAPPLYRSVGLGRSTRVGTPHLGMMFASRPPRLCRCGGSLSTPPSLLALPRHERASRPGQRGRLGPGCELCGAMLGRWWCSGSRNFRSAFWPMRLGSPIRFAVRIRSRRSFRSSRSPSERACGVPSRRPRDARSKELWIGRRGPIGVRGMHRGLTGCVGRFRAGVGHGDRIFRKESLTPALARGITRWAERVPR